MKCSKCGAKVKDGASFCPNCGNKIVRSQDKTPFQIFKENCGVYKKYDDCCDVLVYPIIESMRSAVRNGFSIERNEEILAIRDTSFWSTKNQGLVLTDKGVHVITDNDNINEDTAFYWTWILYQK